MWLSEIEHEQMASIVVRMLEFHVLIERALRTVRFVAALHATDVVASDLHRHSPLPLPML
jgi:hypothetical protein